MMSQNARKLPGPSATNICTTTHRQTTPCTIITIIIVIIVVVISFGQQYNSTHIQGRI